MYKHGTDVCSQRATNARAAHKCVRHAEDAGIGVQKVTNIPQFRRLQLSQKLSEI